MATSNKMTDLVNKIERRLGLLPLTPHLPEWANKKAWVEVIEDDTLMTFSRYFPYQIRFPVNGETCNSQMEDYKRVYYIKDELLEGLTLLGVRDIDWSDFSSDNLSVSQTAGYGYYTPDYLGCPICTFETFLGYQMMADMVSLYNRGIYLDFFPPNKIQITGSANTNLNLDQFVVLLLMKHPNNLQTISATMMNVFEELAQADVATFLSKNLKYYDSLSTVYVDIDLKLSDLENEASKRDNVIEKLEQSYVTASNTSIPLIYSV